MLNIYLNLERMNQVKPFTFEVERGDGEKFQVLYSQKDD